MMMNDRPFGVTILAVLSGAIAVLSAFRVIQFLGIIPFFAGPFSFHAASLWYALMWGLLVWVYIWLTRSLWNVEQGAWLFLVVITVFNLILDFMLLITSGGWQDISASVLLNAIILIYCMLPGVKSAFGTTRIR
jgi:hypothetical protein